MGRYTNKILFMVGLAAAAVLGVEGFTGVDFLNSDATSLMCVLAAVPPVIATIRIHTENTKAALVATFESYADRMELVVERHADRTCKNIHERTLAVLAEANLKAARDVEQMRATFTDTGPFPAIR